MKRKKLTILENLIEKKFGTDPLTEDPIPMDPIPMDTGRIEKLKPKKPVNPKKPPIIRPIEKPKK